MGNPEEISHIGGEIRGVQRVKIVDRHSFFGRPCIIIKFFFFKVMLTSILLTF